VDAFRRANHGVFRQWALLSSGPSRSNTPTDPSAHSQDPRGPTAARRESL